MEATDMMRDLDQIRERDDQGDSARLVMIGVCGLAAACLLFAIGVWIGKDEGASHAARHEDPLARLDALAAQTANTPLPPSTFQERLMAPAGATESADRLAAGAFPAPVPSVGAVPESPAPVAVDPVIRPSVASGRASITNSSAASREPALALVDTAAGMRAAPSAPVHSAPVTDAATAAHPSGASAVAPAGSDGPYTLQVSSFRSPDVARGFAQRLRERGYRAFVTTAPGAGNLVWHRVRIGPFTSIREANRYRSDFETRERLPTFVVRRDEPPSHGG